MRTQWVVVLGAAVVTTAVAVGCLGTDVGGADPAAADQDAATGGGDGASPQGDGAASDGGAEVPTLALDPSRPRIAIGAQATAKLTITRLGLTGEVPVAATGLPPSVTATLPPIAAGASTTELGLTVGDEATPGIYPFTIEAPGVAPLTAAVVVPGTPSALDTSFDADGVLIDSTAADFTSALVLPDGAIVVVGTGAGGWVVKRFDENGVPDATWNAKSAGKVPATNSPRAIARDPASGKLYVVGSSGNEQLTVLRLNADGSVDESYANAGIIRGSSVDHPNGSRANAAVVLPDGKLLVAGRSDPQAFVFRYTTAGEIDAGYARLVTPDADYTGLALIGTGTSMRAVAAGTSFPQSSPPVQLATKFTVDGLRDTTFGLNGNYAFANGCRGEGFALTTDGDGIVVGRSATAPAVCTTRIGLAGVGSAAWTKSPAVGGSGNLTAAAPVFGGSGSYAGGEGGGSQDRFALLERRLPNGDYDTTFAEGGTLRIEDSATPDAYRVVFRSAVPAPDGRLLVVGSRTSGGTSAGYLLRIWE